MRGRKRHRKKRAKWAAEHRRDGLRTIMAGFAFKVPGNRAMKRARAYIASLQFRIDFAKACRSHRRFALACAMTTEARRQYQREAERMGSDE